MDFMTSFFFTPRPKLVHKTSCNNHFIGRVVYVFPFNDLGVGGERDFFLLNFISHFYGTKIIFTFYMALRSSILIDSIWSFRFLVLNQ
jgi:hypothetical protein